MAAHCMEIGFNTALFELGTGVRVGGNVSSVQVTTDDPEGEKIMFSGLKFDQNIHA